MIEELLSYWDLDGADAVPLLGGEQKDVWLVAGEFALRLYPAYVPAASVERECGWLAALGRELPQIPVPIESRRGALAVEHRGRCAVLAPYVYGQPVRADSRAQRRAMAGVLAPIHRAAERLPVHGTSVHPPLRELDWYANHWWDVDELGEAAVTHDLWSATRPRLDAVRNWIGRLDGLPAQVVHNDYGVVNVLIDSDEVAGVIDWDWATVDWRLVDVAHAIRTITSQGLQVENRPAEFLADYRDAGGDLVPDELQRLPTLLRLQVTWSALYDLGRACQGKLDRDGASYRLLTLRTVDELAADLTAPNLR